MFSRSQILVAEFLGTALLLATVVGSGIMAERLADGNVAIALLGNTIPTGAILVVLITMFGPISGAHFNPAVTLAMFLNGDLKRIDGVPYVLAQIAGGIFGVWCAHMMFAEPFFQLSQKPRFGAGQWFAEFVATFGLVLVIFLVVKFKRDAIAMAVGLYITAAYWFTASTSFANPAVTIARGFSDSFAGIVPSSILPFILAQLFGAVAAWGVFRFLSAE
ncbi:MIP/aquaporin family protein [Maritalea porphyrae]|uniref:MIP family protein n=1 Tax=Maritalea porphyrae TaxID=880732 RepID=A0ABQ5UMK1_9HYPH|nr:MIP/aquaporin family protein [Maritalea porphyrae]GLQ16377.1 MIP family protein [Maritalea porphyrae]